MQLKKREIRKIAQGHFDNGLNRQQTIDIIKDEMSNSPSEIAKILRYMPTPAEKSQFQFLNVILISLFIISAMGSVLIAIPMIIENGPGFLPLLFILPSFSIIFIVLLAKNRGRVYQSIIILTALGIFQSFKNFETQGYEAILIGLGFGAVVITVAGFAHHKLTKSFTVKKRRVELENNRVKVEEVIIFEE